MPLLVGIFVGGRGTRMGGVAKGLLPAPGAAEPLAARLVRVGRNALGDPEIVLVGDATAYAALGLRALADDPKGRGPLGGLHALLREGLRTDRDVIALSCDLPYVTEALLRRLATELPDAAALATRSGDGGPWQPFFARYSPGACLPHVTALLDADRRALQGLFDALGASARTLAVSAEEEASLRDWDTPSDVTA